MLVLTQSDFPKYVRKTLNPIIETNKVLIMNSDEFDVYLSRDVGLSVNDIVKIWVLASFVMLSILVTIYTLSAQIDNIYAPFLFLFPQLYYIPIILISVWYPKYSLQCTVLLVAAFLTVISYFYYLGTPIDPFVSGLNAALYIWVVIATTKLAREGDLFNIKYWNIFRNSNVGMIICNIKNQTIVDANNKMAEIIGYTQKDLLKLSLKDLFEDEEECQICAAEIAQNNYIHERKCRLRTKSGESKLIIFSCKKNRLQGQVECTINDITQREREQEELLATTQRLHNFITSSHDLIIMILPDGEIKRFYWAKAEAYNIIPEDIVGRNISDFVRNEFSEDVFDQITDIPDNKISGKLNLSLNIGQCNRHFSTLTGQVHDQNRKIIGYIITMREKTEDVDLPFSQAEDNVSYIRWRNFINTVAHELRTPLQPLLGYLHLILDDKNSDIDPKIIQMLNLCLENVENEREIVEKMFEQSIMDNYRIYLNISEINLVKLIDTTINIGEYHLKATINIDIPEDIVVNADRDRLYQVIDGIISNAIQYNKPPKNVRITYNDDNDNHYIHIIDNGIGIENSSKAAIFEPYYITNAECLSREYGRIGMGLSIAQGYMKAQGGKITVKSVPGKGSTFTIRLPKKVNVSQEQP